MKKQILLAIAVVAGSILPFGAMKTADASITMTISEVGSNVQASWGAGTIDTTGLTLGSYFSGCDSLWTGDVNLNGAGVSGAGGSCRQFVGSITTTTTGGWTSGGGSSSWTSQTGSGGLIGASNYFSSGPAIFILDDPGVAFLGVNSISGGSGTVNGASFASLGLTAGSSITYSWGADSFTIQYGANSNVPEP